jgi:hypothetical protein
LNSGLESWRLSGMVVRGVRAPILDMKIKHKCVESSIFKLIKTIEIDICFYEDSWSTRIELFCDTENQNIYRCHVWALELFRLTPSFPQDRNNKPKDITDDLIKGTTNIRA